jgi:hypothetical protein
MRAFAVIACLLLAPSAQAHDQWANGDPIPAWVKAECCGPADAHQLSPDDVSLQDDGWHFRQVDTVVPRGKELLSQDGAIWAFWNPALGRDAPIYCFFAPMEF